MSAQKQEFLKIGIAGYGVIGPRRQQFIDKHPQLKTVAVCDIKFSEKGTLPDSGIRCYPDYKAMLKEEALDVLFVCLPPNIAPEVTVAGLDAGMHVFAEKPPGRNLNDIEKIIAAEQRNPGLVLKFGFNHRYHDSVRDALEIVRSGKLGSVINMRGVYGKSAFIPWPRPMKAVTLEDAKQYWRTSRSIAGGGILLDQGIHMVDLMRLFGGDFTEVKSFVKNSYWKLDVEDNVYALLTNSSGVVAMLHSTATQWRHRFHLEICLTDGALTLSGILSGTKSYGQETLTVSYKSEYDVGNPKEQITSYIEDNSWRDEITEFADCILNKKNVMHGSSEEAYKTMELIGRIYNANSLMA